MMFLVVALMIVHPGLHSFMLKNSKISLKVLYFLPSVSLMVKNISQVNLLNCFSINSIGVSKPIIIGDSFTDNHIEIEYNNTKGKKKTLNITPDEPELFIQQVRNMQTDSTITGYVLPNTLLRNICLFLYVLLIAVTTYYFYDYGNQHIVFGALYGVLTIFLYNMIKKSFNRKLYKPYYENLDKYAIRDIH